MTTPAIGAAVLSVALLSFALVFFPVWALVRFMQEHRTSQYRFLWVLILVTWPVGALVYGIRSKGRPAFRASAWLSLFLVVMFTTFVLRFASARAKTLRDEVMAVGYRVAEADVVGGPEVRDSVLRHLHALHDEVSASVLRYPDNEAIALLAKMMNEALADHRLTPDELADWNAVYAQRDLLDPLRIRK
jgi:hypothetical protein